MTTTPPVSLGELRAHINYLPGSTQIDDEELWRKLLGATRTVEQRCGAMEPRTVSASVYPQDGLPDWPVMAILTVDRNAVTDPSPSTYERLYCRRWTRFPREVVYRVGRDPVPDDLMEATLIIGAHMWETQRNPAPAAMQFTGSGGTPAMTPRGFALPNRALELMQPYMVGGQVA